MGKSDPWRFLAYAGLILLTILLGISTSVGLGGKGQSSPPLAIASFVLALPVLYLAHRVLPKDKRAGRTFEPLAMYIVFGFLTMIIYPVFLGSKSASSAAKCLANVKQLALTVTMYAYDHDERLPMSSAWQSATDSFRKFEGLPRCPNASSPVNYGMNSAVSNVSVIKMASPSETVLLFELDSQLPNAHGGQGQFTRRHHGTGSLAYVDGRAKRINEFVGKKTRWRP